MGVRSLTAYACFTFYSACKCVVISNWICVQVCNRFNTCRLSTDRLTVPRKICSQPQLSSFQVWTLDMDYCNFQKSTVSGSLRQIRPWGFLSSFPTRPREFFAEALPKGVPDELSEQIQEKLVHRISTGEMGRPSTFYPHKALQGSWPSQGSLHNNPSI